MTKIKCNIDKEVEAYINNDGKVRCANLEQISSLKRECWNCKITKKPCGYNMYKSLYSGQSDW